MINNQVRVGIGVLVRKDDRLLLLRRINSHGAGTWSPPGGHLDYGETPFECAIRECKEETDVDICNVKFKCITNDIFDEGKHYITIWIEADYLSGTAKINAKNELNEVAWFTMDQFPTPLFLSLQNLLDGKAYINK